MGIGLLAAAAMLGGLVEPPPRRHPSVKSSRAWNVKPTKATKRNAKRKKANKPMWRL